MPLSSQFRCFYAAAYLDSLVKTKQQVEVMRTAFHILALLLASVSSMTLTFAEHEATVVERLVQAGTLSDREKYNAIGGMQGARLVRSLNRGNAAGRIQEENDFDAMKALVLNGSGIPGASYHELVEVKTSQVP